MTYNLPQNDRDQATRQAELQQQAAAYKYNRDIGVPLIDTAGDLDKNKPDYNAKVLARLVSLRANLQMIYDHAGMTFQEPRPTRDLNQLMTVVKSGSNPAGYFTPDLGFVTGGSRPVRVDDYINKVFMDHDGNNEGSAPVPEIAATWDSDATFAYNFLAGPNPNQLQRYRSATRPADFDLSGVDLGSLPGFAGDSVQAAISQGRVYYVDRSDMAELFANLPGAPAPNAAPRVFDKVTAPDWKYIYAPYAAFAVPPSGAQLLPIAIQCGPKVDGHQIYTPRDGNSWKMARVCVLAAHNNHHEVVTHLGVTHLLVDAFVIATRLRLHINHPVHQLLNAHFEGTAPINIAARTSLIQPEKSVDRLVGSKIEKNYPYLGKRRLAYSFRDNFLPNLLRRNGVDDPALLPNYPYREDATLIWNAVHAWISDFVAVWYRSDADVAADSELQAWATEISAQGQVKDFCLPGGGVQGRGDLIEMLTMIAFTAGPQHAAVNFPQGKEMVFVPANPLAGYAPAPKGTGHSDQDLLDMFPPLDVAVHTWSILSLLAGVNNTRLGDYRGAFLAHPATEAARLKFGANLLLIEHQINQANDRRRKIFGLDYVHLLPSRIPASINI